MDQDHPHLELPAYALELVSDLKARSGAPLRIMVSDGFAVDTQFNLASSDRPYHDLLIQERYTEHLVHAVVNAAKKGIRIYDAPAFERLYPAPRTDQMPDPNSVLPELGATKELIRAGQFQRFASSLIDTTVQHMATLPIDLRVENEISEQIPEHRDHQVRYLNHRLNRYEEVLSAQPRGYGNSIALRASLAMTIASASECAFIADVEEPAAVRDHDLYPLAEELQQIVRDPVIEGYPGDRDIIDGWAEWLEIQDWYEWKQIDLH